MQTKSVLFAFDLCDSKWWCLIVKSSAVPIMVNSFQVVQEVSGCSSSSKWKLDINFFLDFRFLFSDLLLKLNLSVSSNISFILLVSIYVTLLSWIDFKCNDLLFIIFWVQDTFKWLNWKTPFCWLELYLACFLIEHTVSIVQEIISNDPKSWIYRCTKVATFLH